MGKATSRSDRARQTPELLGPGKGTKCSPNRICASEGYLSAEPERLRLGRCMQPRASLRRFLAEHHRAGGVCVPQAGTGSQSRKGWKGAIAAPERLYLPNCKQASLLRLLGVLDSHHLPHKGPQWYTQKTEQQRQERRQVAATTLAKHLRYSDLGRAKNAVPTESVPLRAT